MDRLTEWTVMAPWAATTAAAFCLSCPAVWIAAAVARRIGFVDRANANTGNAGGAAMGGGVAVILVLIGVTHAVAGESVPLSILLPVAFAGMLGLVDDLYALHPGVKVLGQSVCILVYLVMADFGLFGAMIAGPFLVMAANAWNVVDVMDGLLGWIGALAFAGAGIVFLIQGSNPAPLAIAALAAAGSMGGFLVWNRHPARVLLGDAGSLPLGLLYGILIVEGFRLAPELGATLIIPGFIPFFEVGFIMTQRTMRGIPFYRTTPDHFALRLRRHGHPIPAIIRPVIVVGVSLSLVAGLIASSGFHNFLLGAGVGIVLLSTVPAFRYFGRMGTEGASRPIPASSEAAHLR